LGVFERLHRKRMMPETACLGDVESIEFPLLCGGRQSYARVTAGEPQKIT
jgi:hypothetical protein